MTEREQFEAWAKARYAKNPHFWLRQIDDGGYSCGMADSAWEAWQAARAQPAQAVPEQTSEGEFAPDAKLMELADKIDHEQNWRHSGIFQRDHLTQDQKDRVLAGVMLRRYADLMAPESWRLFPPKSVVSHSYRAATLEAVVKMAERHGIVGKEGA